MTSAQSKNAIVKGLPLALVKRVVNVSRGGMLETHIFGVRQLVDRLQCLTVSQHHTAPAVWIQVVGLVGANPFVSDRLQRRLASWN